MAREQIIDMGLSEHERLELAHEVTTRAVAQVYPSPDEFMEAVGGETRLTAYMGIDPTAPDMHIGHGSQLHKLRRLQMLGHKVILLIGDFTATIGDPTDKTATRVKLSHDEVLENTEGYKQQAGKILDFNHSDNPVEIKYNSEWLGDMDFADVLELASEFTVQQVLERDMFRKRIDSGKPVGLHEFMYPMMQGWDSVMMDVDIEIGGSDQIFNMLVGSTLLKRHLGKQKYVLVGELVVDPRGKKIGKSEGNMITLNDDPYEMFHKIMLWSDEIVPHALELCSQLPLSQIKELQAYVEEGKMSGLESKLFLATQIVSELHGADAAKVSNEQYNLITTNESNIDIESLTSYSTKIGQNIVDMLHESGLANSKSQARRLIAGNAVRINGNTIDENWMYNGSTDDNPLVLQVGKKILQNFRKIETKK